MKLHFCTALLAASSLYGQSCPVEMAPIHFNIDWTAKIPNPEDPLGAPMWASDIEVKIKNITAKPIQGIKLFLGYYDALNELHGTLQPLMVSDTIKPGKQKTAYWPHLNATGLAKGWIIVPVKIVFEDGSKWANDFKKEGCLSDFWINSKHPKTTTLTKDEQDTVLNLTR